MGEWISMDRWPDCRSMERPGIIFELANADGLSLFTACGPLPKLPFDWKSPPVRFRAIDEITYFNFAQLDCITDHDCLLGF